MTERELEQLADLVADRLADRLLPLLADRAPGLVDAATLAAALGVSRDTIYANADKLGAVRIGNGARPRLRFDVDRASEAFEPAPAVPAAPAPARRRKARPPSVPLLPIGGRDA